MQQCIVNVTMLGFEHIELEVDSENVGAVRLYEKMSFVINRVNGRATIMQLNTREEA